MTICVPIHLSIKLGQWYIDLISDNLQLLIRQSAMGMLGWGWLGRNPAQQSREWKKRDREKGEQTDHGGQVLSSQNLTEAAMLMNLVQRSQLAMTVLDPWVVFVAKRWLEVHNAAHWSRKTRRHWNDLTPPSPLQSQLCSTMWHIELVASHGCGQISEAF